MGEETTQVSQSIPGRGNRECKSPETESCLGCSRSREEASGSGAEGAWEQREERGPRGSGNQVTRGSIGFRSKRNGETWQVISRRVM